MRIERADSAEALVAASHLFDHPVDAAGAQRFLDAPGHHLLLALDDAGDPVGFVSGVETTHPDKGTEMFLYELAVDDGSRRLGAGRALVDALADAGPRARVLRHVGEHRRGQRGGPPDVRRCRRLRRGHIRHARVDRVGRIMTEPTE